GGAVFALPAREEAEAPVELAEIGAGGGRAGGGEVPPRGAEVALELRQAAAVHRQVGGGGVVGGAAPHVGERALRIGPGRPELRGSPSSTSSCARRRKAARVSTARRSDSAAAMVRLSSARSAAEPRPIVRAPGSTVPEMCAVIWIRASSTRSRLRAGSAISAR